MHQEQAAKRYYITGMVQGVGYRYFARRAALRLGVAGYVMNLRDGRVHVYAVGRSDSLVEFRRELERGPQSASVGQVWEQEAPIEPRYMSGFSIQYDD